jgi:hypothetical protein
MKRMTKPFVPYSDKRCQIIQAYEDTGYTPDDVINMQKFLECAKQDLADYQKAKDEGRILPEGFQIVTHGDIFDGLLIPDTHAGATFWKNAKNTHSIMKGGECFGE